MSATPPSPPVRRPSGLETRRLSAEAARQSAQLKLGSMAIIASACEAISRAKRLIDQSAGRLLDVQLKYGIEPRRGGLAERLLDPANDTPCDSGSFTLSSK